MLATKYSLKGKDNFDKVEKQGILYQSKDFGVSVLKKDKSKTSRFGFVISRRVDKLAVNRNRVKRAMSESVRQNIKRIEKGYDMVFLAKKSLIKDSTDEIMSKIKTWIEETEL